MKDVNSSQPLRFTVAVLKDFWKETVYSPEWLQVTPRVWPIEWHCIIKISAGQMLFISNKQTIKDYSYRQTSCLQLILHCPCNHFVFADCITTSVLELSLICTMPCTRDQDILLRTIACYLATYQCDCFDNSTPYCFVCVFFNILYCGYVSLLHTYKKKN